MKIRKKNRHKEKAKEEEDGKRDTCTINRFMYAKERYVDVIKKNRVCVYVIHNGLEDHALDS